MNGIKYGLDVICEYPDSHPEPEGVVFFEKSTPDIGTEIELCRSRTGVVVRMNGDTVICRCKEDIIMGDGLVSLPKGVLHQWAK